MSSIARKDSDMPADSGAMSAQSCGSTTVPFAPYYQDEAVTIYNADCRKVLPWLQQVDLILADPPYGIHYSADFKKWNGADSGWDKVAGDEKPFDPAILFMWDAKAVITWGANHYSHKLPAGDWLVWDKRCSEKADRMIGSPIEIAWMTGDGRARIKRLQHGGVINADSSCGNNEKRVHPTQKPLALMRWCLSLVPDAATVLDPFMGSGTTLVAAKLEGRKAVGIEISEKYCEAAANRLRQGVLF